MQLTFYASTSSSAKISSDNKNQYNRAMTAIIFIYLLNFSAEELQTS